jgi:hypothetical protein
VLVRVGSPVRFLALFISRYSPQRAFASRCVKPASAVSPLQGCCDGRRISPLEAGVQPMQASPCVQDLRCITLHPFAFNRFSDMLLSPSGFPSRLAGCPKRFLRSQPPAPVGQSHVRRNGAPQHSGWHRARSTVNGLSALHTWCAWLTENRYLEINPAKRIKLVGRQESSSREGLSDTQVNACSVLNIYRKSGNLTFFHI